MSPEPRDPSARSNEPLHRFTWVIIVLVLLLVLGVAVFTRLRGMWG
jgi:preprotein translocase subunit SecG